jgi:hypothetical protein
MWRKTYCPIMYFYTLLVKFMNLHFSRNVSGEIVIPKLWARFLYLTIMYILYICRYKNSGMAHRRHVKYFIYKTSTIHHGVWIILSYNVFLRTFNQIYEPPFRHQSFGTFFYTRVMGKISSPKPDFI